MRKSASESQRERERIQRTLEDGGVFLLASHRRPDGDSLGSMMALAQWLEERGSRAYPLSPDGVPDPYGFLPTRERVLSAFPAGVEDYVAIVLDAPELGRTGAAAEAISGARLVIDIDHHPGNARFGDLNLVDVEASSTALILYELLSELDGISGPVASLLYVGVLTDTGAFRYGNTDGRTLAAAAGLVGLGADPSALARGVYGEQPLGSLKLLGMVLSSAESLLDGRVIVMSLTDEMRRDAGSTGEEIEGLAGYGRLVRGSQVSVLMREEDGGVRVSLRSLGDVDVNEVARGLGGGGHASAAGVFLDGTIEKVRQRVIEALVQACG